MEGDAEKAVSLLQDIQQKTKDVTTHVKTLCKQVEAGKYNTNKGISFLEMKYQLLLSYLTNLTYTMLKKTRGESIEGEPSIDRLVEIRTVLEKIRPIDHKLKYQIDKVIKTATTGTTDASDPLRFKANPDNLVNKLDEESESESESDEEEDKQSKPKVYVPPKLSAVHYDGDDTMAERQQRHVERAKQRALSSSMMKDLRDEYYEGPQEIKETRDLHRLREDKRSKERQNYEEDHFVRLSVSKKEKNAMKRMATMSALESLTQFDDMSALHGAGVEGGIPAKKRKSDKFKKGKKGKGKKGFRKKRR